MGLFRCLRPKCAEGKNGFEFQAEKAQCPKCGLRREDPRMGQFLVPLHIVHFDPPDEPELGKGKNYRACDPGQPITVPMTRDGKHPASRDHGTAVPQAVTCPACKQTPVYKAALSAQAVTEEPAPVGDCGCSQKAKVSEEGGAPSLSSK